MHPTDTLLAAACVAVARAAASGVGSGASRQDKEAKSADRSFERDLRTFAASLETMWTAPAAVSSAGSRMSEGFGKAYADHYAAKAAKA